MNVQLKQTRGILIDPKAHTVSYVTIEGAVLQGLYKTLECSDVNRVGLGSIEGQEQDLWIDGEGMLCNWDDQQFFKIGESDAIAGRGLILASDDEGDSISAHEIITPESIARLITWLSPQEVDVPAPFLQTIAPDGTVEKTPLSHSDRWNYENQP
jgi:hypothetical protein